MFCGTFRGGRRECSTLKNFIHKWILLSCVSRVISLMRSSLANRGPHYGDQRKPLEKNRGAKKLCFSHELIPNLYTPQSLFFFPLKSTPQSFRYFLTIFFLSFFFSLKTHTQLVDRHDCTLKLHINPRLGGAATFLHCI